MKTRIRNVSIRSIATAVPADIVELASLQAKFGSEEVTRTINSTGIHRIRKSAPSLTAGDLCLAAAQNLLRADNIDRSSIEALVLVTITPDYLCPQTSPSIHHRLGLNKDVPCFDLSYGCSGYIYGLLQAASLIQGLGLKRVLLLAGETMTKAVDPDDRATAMLFGDGGSASIIDRTEGVDLCFALGNDGRSNQSIIYPSSGFRQSAEPRKLLMDGAGVVSFVAQEIPDNIRSLLSFSNINTSDIDLFVSHQASKIILGYLTKSLSIPESKSLSVLAEFGNTGSASVPLALTASSGLPAQRKNVVLVGFGVGLSWGSALVDLSNTRFFTPIDVIK